MVLVAVIAAGGFLWAYAARSIETEDQRWERQMQSDLESWMQLLRPDPRLLKTPEEVPGFLEAWQARRSLYDAAHADELRLRLHAYLEFLAAEYADAADIWDSGRVDVVSQPAVRARMVLRKRLGPFADRLIEQSDTTVREQAYLTSPVTIRDPDATNYRRVYLDILDWVAVAKEAVDRHVAVEP
jgi:hypothetical protein